jgi:hypothetical protein
VTRTLFLLSRGGHSGHPSPPPPRGSSVHPLQGGSGCGTTACPTPSPSASSARAKGAARTARAQLRLQLGGGAAADPAHRPEKEKGRLRGRQSGACPLREGP